jgi:hypothetical protein
VSGLTKRCTHCGIEKPLARFSPHPLRPDGLQSWCKSCRADYIRQRRETDSEVAARDAEQVRAYSAAGVRLREANRDEFDRYYAEELAKRGLSTADHFTLRQETS